MVQSPNTHKRIFTRFLTATALALVLQSQAGLFVDGAQAQSAAALAYQRSDYGYCDAKKVAAVWGVSIGDAKVVIGNKILGNRTHLINADIASTRNTVRCGWAELEMTYQDAVEMARYWNIQPHEAKLKAERFVSEDGKKVFREWFRAQTGYRLSSAGAGNLQTAERHPVAPTRLGVDRLKQPPKTVQSSSIRRLHHRQPA